MISGGALGSRLRGVGALVRRFFKEQGAQI